MKARKKKSTCTYDGACYAFLRNLIAVLEQIEELDEDKREKLECLMDDVVAAIQKTKLAEAAGVCPGCFAHHTFDAAAIASATSA